jgi:ubiquinone/menaquinone biosynthesis C-methylase UbiE
VHQYLRRRGKNTLVAFCPERVVQGNSLRELETLPQIVSGTTPEAEEVAADLFGTIAPKIVRMAGCLMAHDTQAQREIEFFDRFAAEQGAYDVLREDAYARLREVFVRAVRPRPDERLIDLGCGTGAFTRRFRSLVREVAGMDISPVSVERARALAPDIEYLVGDITDTKLPDASRDIVMYAGVLHHFSTRAARLQVLREGHRLLAPGGRMFAFDPSAQSPSVLLYRHPRSPFCSQKGKTQNEVLLHRAELSGELRDAGFVDPEIRGVAGISFAYVEGRFAKLILPLYNACEQLLHYSPFEDRLGTFLVTVAFKA